MKLYSVFMDNGMHYGDGEWTTVLTVAENDEQADIKGKELMEKRYGKVGRPYYYVEEVEEVEGYKIQLVKE